MKNTEQVSDQKVVTLNKCYYKATRYPKTGQQSTNGFKIVAYSYWGGDLESIPDSIKKKNGGEIKFTAKGNFLPEMEEAVINLKGYFEPDPNKKYPDTFVVMDSTFELPESREGLERYLVSVFHGIGPVIAREIVSRFGEKAATIFSNDDHDEELLTIKGITRTRLISLKNDFIENNWGDEMLSFIKRHPSLTMSQANAIFAKYGAKSITILEEDPYRITNIDGIGFKKADKIALGLSNASFTHSKERIRACVLYVLREIETQGHTFLYQPHLIAILLDLLGFDIHNPMEKELLFETLKEMEFDGDLVPERYLDKNGNKIVAVYETLMYLHENNSADLLVHLSKAPIIKPYNVEDSIKNYERKQGIQLHPIQKEAVKVALNNAVSVITGGPGTGKTTIINAIKNILSESHRSLNIVMLAPTGRASKRMSETTQHPASTIHSGLGITPGSHRVNPVLLEGVDAIIVDESSMIDAHLAYQLFSCITPGTQLILIGDVDQLPSVGPGTVLKNIIESGSIPVVRLTQGYRQKGNSLIAINAEKIRDWDLPDTFEGHAEPTKSTRHEIDYGPNFIFKKTSEQDHSVDVIVSEYKKAVDIYGIDEVAVLTPIRKKGNSTGVTDLNPILQNAINPFTGKNEVEITPNLILRIGDKIISNKNKLGLANGDIGYVISFDTNQKVITAQFTDITLEITFQEASEMIGLAYATTIHKSQGSEYKCVIISIEKSHFLLLKRNLVYTAITRAREKCIFVGNQQAFYQSIASNSSGKDARNTLLTKFLKKTTELTAS